MCDYLDNGVAAAIYGRRCRCFREHGQLFVNTSLGHQLKGFPRVVAVFVCGDSSTLFSWWPPYCNLANSRMCVFFSWTCRFDYIHGQRMCMWPFFVMTPRLLQFPLRGSRLGNAMGAMNRCVAVIHGAHGEKGRHDPESNPFRATLWLVMMDHHDSSWWIIMICHDESTWPIVINRHDESSRCIVMMHHVDSPWWLTMILHDEMWWLIVTNQYNHHAESSWCIIMIHREDSSWWLIKLATWWRITTNMHHDDLSWWIMMVHHVDSAWLFIMARHCESIRIMMNHRDALWSCSITTRHDESSWRIVTHRDESSWFVMKDHVDSPRCIMMSYHD